MIVHAIGRLPHPSDSVLDAWVLQTYAAGKPPHDLTAWHLRRCPRCRRRAAIAWALMADPPPVPGRRIPPPDLSLLDDARPHS